jgi:hypothetical protein
MIKKFITFINESGILKTEYQILHLNREERMEYFKQRFEYLKSYGGYFHDYEYSLLPKLIKQEYNQTCVDRYYTVIDKDQFDDFSKEMKIQFIDKMIYRGHSDKYFDYLSDDLKYYLIDKRINSNYYGEYLSFNQFKWCDKKLRDRYINMRLKHINIVDDDIFSICSKKQKDKIINNLIIKNRLLSNVQFRYLSPIEKFNYVDTLNKRYYFLEDFDDYQRKWYLAYKRKHNL